VTSLAVPGTLALGSCILRCWRRVRENH
jgi:hypothetical protein